MLSVHPPIQMGRYDMSMDQNTINERDQVPMTSQPKQLEKKQFITPTKVIIGVAILCILAMASYKVYTITFPAPSQNKMTQSHSKIIQTPGSSSGRDTSSQTGSQSSRGTKASDRPIGVAQTVGKDKISSNPGTGSDGDGQQPSEQDNDGSKRNQKLRKNKLDGSSTEGDSEQSVQEEESGENEGQAVVWPNNGGSNGMPLVGSTRK